MSYIPRLLFVTLAAISLAAPCRAGHPEVSGELGKLKQGVSEAQVLQLLGKPDNKGKAILWEATGLYMQPWRYSALGIELDMSSESKKGPKSIERITAVAPCDLKTEKGIQIGSTEKEVKKAYGKVEDKEASKAGETFVAGSVYGGIIFSFTGGKVSQIFIGAAAE